jgi:hypothetical protein
LGHSYKYCKNGVSCPRYGNNHNLQDCEVRTSMCVNCNNLNVKNKNEDIPSISRVKKNPRRNATHNAQYIFKVNVAILNILGIVLK